MKSFSAVVALVAYLFACSVPGADADLYIVNGTRTTIEKIPFQVSILFFNEHDCAAVILDENTMLTAAHCFKYFYEGFSTNLKPWSARVGSSFWRYGGQVVQFKSIVFHPEYDKATTNNDIAILKTTAPIIFSASVQPVALPDPSRKLIPGEKLQISGWGRLSPNGPTSKQLQMINLPVLSKEKCIEIMSPISPIRPSMLCAGDLDGLGDSCSGDSGGPAVDENNVLVGITSWGKGCSVPGYAGVYTDVAYMSDWIQNNRI